ncbi:histidinol-phosphate aminotransferase [Aliiroseovarius zhejiangensis]|uniref:Histidinol-phosphate aminotransferase n=1 Tax=Aliiroseovarius zhejiangensis TaxID=1632025 RepID=A0ABQ3IYF7_9RHOB|nr:histidinol-phosphate transaminase [Aliiroseovarius zhejiangensis]GHE97709.1 histidinol-phosphate aminotransferase [Aliiroseovarius zhejiangensis]
MTKIEPQPGIMQIKPYVGGASSVDGVANVIKLSSNENPFGPSPLAIEAFQRAGRELHRYPNTDHASLRAAIGSLHKLDPDRIICGVGSDEVITFLCQCYSGPGTEVIYTEHGFSMYKISALAAGADPVMVPERERMVDVDEILKAVTERTSLVFVTNPGNPTGTMVSQAELARLARELPDTVLLVLDGAYAEYVDGFDGGARLVDKHDNVFMTRTFSKMYGLGGLRIGWGYGAAEVIDVLNRVRGPFNLSMAQQAAAEAALADREHVARCLAENTRLRAWLAEALAELGVPSDTSCTNFILARLASADEAADCYAFLQDQGIIVRMVAGYGLPHCLRITIGDEASCRRVAHMIGRFKGGAPGSKLMLLDEDRFDGGGAA